MTKRLIIAIIIAFFVKNSRKWLLNARNMRFKDFKPYLPSLFLMMLCIISPPHFIPPQNDPICIYDAMLFHFTHANIFHLLVNSLFLLQFKPRWSSVLAAYFVASACAELPFAGVSMPTCGLSAICFAMIARHDVSWRVLNWKLLLINAASAFFPMFNWKIHLFSYVISFVLWKIIYLAKKN